MQLAADEILIQKFGGKVDRLVADVFQNIPLTYPEAIALIKDAMESLCNTRGSSLLRPTGVGDDWIVSIAKTDLGLVFTSPRCSQFYVALQEKHNWPFMETADPKWQAFVQRSPLWTIFANELSEVSNARRPDIILEKKLGAKKLNPTQIATFINFFQKPCWESPLDCPHITRVPARTDFGTVDRHNIIPHHSWRFSPGNVTAKNDCQKSPYVKLILFGQHYDVNGNQVEGETAESHIELVRFDLRRIIRNIKTKRENREWGCSCLNIL